jgi:exodeoxyribonuclease VII large subunit
VTLQLPLGALAVERPHAVSAVVAAAREAIEAVFRLLWVEGEIADLKRYPSGVWYLTLRDKDAQLRCVVFRFEARRLARTLAGLADGAQVFARGDLSVGKRGELQLLVRELLPRPEGGFYQLQFEKARAALERDGLLDQARKRALPAYPRRIAVVTSPEGAVWHDIVTTVAGRWPYIELLLVGSRVQGDGAAGDMCRAIKLACRLPGLSTLIIARGGGAKDDLACFNDEQVARAVAQAPVPVISAVGHETDVTLTDLVADARAPTPTGAAQMAVPDRQAVLRQVAALESALGRAAGHTVDAAGYRLARAASRVDRAVARRLAGVAQRLELFAHRMDARVAARIEQSRSTLQRAAASLDALSPLTVLARGYSVARDAAGKVIHRTADLRPGTRFRLRVVDGEVRAVVESET